LGTCLNPPEKVKEEKTETREKGDKIAQDSFEKENNLGKKKKSHRPLLQNHKVPKRPITVKPSTH